MDIKKQQQQQQQQQLQQQQKKQAKINKQNKEAIHICQEHSIINKHKIYKLLITSSQLF